VRGGGKSRDSPVRIEEMTTPELERFPGRDHYREKEEFPEGGVTT